MKTKYDLAIKYYSETGNFEQINLAYNELELFNQTYESFFYYLKLDNKTLESLIKNSYKILEESNIESKVKPQKNLYTEKDKNLSSSSKNIYDNNNKEYQSCMIYDENTNNTNKTLLNQFSRIVALIQLKISESIFEDASFNNELLVYTKKKFKLETEQKQLLKAGTEKVSKETEIIDNEDFSTRISCLLLFLMLLFSFIMIYVQSYFYNLNLAEHIKNNRMIN